MKTLPTAAILALAASAGAQITPYETTFSERDSIAGWTATTTVKGAGVVLQKSPADFDAGDGLPGDGALMLRAGDTVPGNEYFTRELTGKLAAGETLTLAGTVFNPGKSHNSALFAELVRADGKLLARSESLSSGTTDNIAFKPVAFSITYTATPEDAGSGVAIRFAEKWNATSRIALIDHLKLTAVTPGAERPAGAAPKPQATGKAGIAPYHSEFNDKRAAEGWTTDGGGKILIGGAAGGSLVLRAGDATPGNEYFTRPLTGTLAEGQTLTVTGTARNPANSHNASIKLELVRDDGKVLATSAELGGAPTKDPVGPVVIRLNYTATAEDHGRGASLRFAEKWNAVVRILAVDHLDLTATPIP